MKEKKPKEMESRIATDPKFRRLPKTKESLQVDKDERFKRMFEDKKYKIQSQVDKTGKRLAGFELKKHYNLSSESEDDDEGSETEQGTSIESKKKKIKSKAAKGEKANKETDEEKNDELKVITKADKKVPKAVSKKLKNLSVDYARGEGVLFSESSSSDEESEAEEDEGEKIEHNWGELDADAERTEQATYRLAACNLDWDKVRACDLMVLFNSFLPATGVIKSISIYPSEFGKERLKKEEIEGPDLGADTEEASEEGSKYHMEKLRKYQMERLKYYYAVITFNTVDAANKVYGDCDGMEYESSGTKIDLRFIPDDMTFEDEPRETCDRLPEKYEPKFFTTTALQQAKVDLTWDETPAERLEVIGKINAGKLEEITDKELEYIVACSDDDVDDDNNEENAGGLNEDTLAKYKALLAETEGTKDESDEDEDGEMEFTWDTQLQKKTEDSIKKKTAEEKTPFEQLMDKKKEKRKEKKKLRNQRQQDEESDDVPSDVDMSNPYFAEEFDKAEFKQKKKKKEKADKTPEDNAELALLLNNEDAEDDAPLTKKNKRKLKKMKKEHKDIEFPVMEDSRFAEMASSHLYAIDPDEAIGPKSKKKKLKR